MRRSAFWPIVASVAFGVLVTFLHADMTGWSHRLPFDPVVGTFAAVAVFFFSLLLADPDVYRVREGDRE